MSNLIDAVISEHLLSFWILLSIVLIEKFLPWPDKYHPLSLIKLMAKGMAHKVLPSNSRQISQQKIAGILAPLILLIPICTIMAVFILLSQYPMFFEIVMLLIALKFQYVISQTKKVTSALRSEKKILARQMLAPIVLRETDKLSPMGMVKANIESLLLRFCYQYCGVIFWFLLTGGVGALLYRVLFELSHSWNSKLLRFRYFGSPIRILMNILQFAPSIIGCGSIILATNISLGATALFQRKSYSTLSMFILNTCGKSIGITLGGPVFYNNNKIRMPVCGGQKQVTLADNEKTLLSINTATWILVTGSFLCCSIYFAIMQSR